MLAYLQNLQILKLSDIYKLKVSIKIYNISNEIWNIQLEKENLNYETLIFKPDQSPSLIAFIKTKLDQS